MQAFVGTIIVWNEAFTRPILGSGLDRVGNPGGIPFRYVGIAEILRYAQNDDGKLDDTPPGFFTNQRAAASTWVWPQLD